MSRSSAHSALVSACISLMVMHGVYATKTHTMGVFDPATGRRRRVHGVRGWPDITGVMPGGRFIAVEVKTGRGRLTSEQAAVRSEIESRGGVYVLCRDIDDLIEALGREMRGSTLPGTG